MAATEHMDNGDVALDFRCEPVPVGHLEAESHKISRINATILAAKDKSDAIAMDRNKELAESDIELSDSQRNELEALSGDKSAVIRVVSDLRRYRELAKKLLASRYRDGECDAVALRSFECGIEEIEYDE